MFMTEQHLYLEYNDYFNEEYNIYDEYGEYDESNLIDNIHTYRRNKMMERYYITKEIEHEIEESFIWELELIHLYNTRI